MGKEIERKYLVISSEYKEMATSRSRIKQGYLQRDPECTVRIRLRDDRGFITVKGITKGDTRLEYEYEIPEKDAEEMLNLCLGKIIDKTRWLVPFEGHIWEVDEFLRDHEGLVVAEIELKSSDAQYSEPPFVGRQVTGDPRYYNSNL